MVCTRMNKKNPTAVSSSTQHPYNYDGKETLSHPVATIDAEMNQQINIIFLQLVTLSIASSLDTSKSVESFPHPPAYVPLSSALFLRWDTADSLEAPPFITNIAPNMANITSLSSEIPSHCFYHGSNSISSLSSTTAKEYRKVPYTIIPFEKKKGLRTPSTPVYCFQHQLFVRTGMKELKL